MLTLFRTNQLLTSILLLLYLLVFHLASIISPPTFEVSGSGILSALVLEGLSGLHPAISKALAITLVFFQAVLLILLSITHRIREDITLFAGVFFCLFASFLPEFIPLNPVMMANLFLLLGLSEMMSTYKKSDPIGHIFNTGVWIGVASLFYFSAIVFAGWGLICLSILHATKLRDNLALIIGAAVPYILAATIYFWFDQWDLFWQEQIAGQVGWLRFDRPAAVADWGKLAGFGLLLLIALLSNNQYSSKKSIEVQKKIQLLYWWMVFTGLGFLIQQTVSLNHLLLLCPSLGLLLALNFSTMQARWAESIHLLLLLAALALHFSPWLIGEQL